MMQVEQTHCQTLQETQEVQNKTQETLDKIGETLGQLAQTVQGIRDLRATYRKFHGEFCEAISYRESAPHIPVNVLRTSKKVFLLGQNNISSAAATFEGVIDELATKSHIVVLTGKGVAGCDFDLGNEEIFTSTNFKQNPEEVWKWHTELRKTLAKSRANLSHQALADLQVLCRQSNIKFTMVTQDVDGYYVDTMLETTKKTSTSTDVVVPTTIKKANNNTTKVTDTRKVPNSRGNSQVTNDTKRPVSAPTEPVSHPLENIYEINGNVRYMCCSNDASDKPYECPEIDDSETETYVPRCPSCQHITRPHMMFRDEPSQEQKYYHEDIVLQQVESMDCLLVVGASIDNGLVAKIVEKAAEKSLLMIEISSKPCIKYENVRQILKEPEAVLPILYEGTQKKIMEKNKTIVEEKKKTEKKEVKSRRDIVSVTRRLRSQSKNKKIVGGSKWM